MSLPIAEWVVRTGAAREDLSLSLLDLKEWDLPMFAEAYPPATGRYTGEKQRAWAEAIGASDGFILVAPEYNHGMSAVLKNALDTVAAEWERKPVSFVAHGGMGGARSVEQLRLTAAALGMAPLSSALHIQNAASMRDGDRFDGGEALDRRLGRLCDELVWWGNTLKAAR